MDIARDDGNGISAFSTSRSNEFVQRERTNAICIGFQLFIPCRSLAKPTL